MEEITQTPSMDVMLNTIFTPQQWLNYYKNDWQRRAVATSVDVQYDTDLKALHGKDYEVQSPRGGVMTVGERLEERKIAVAHCLAYVAAMDELIALGDSFQATMWDDKALAVADDMKPQPKAGDACTMADGTTPGTLQDDLANPGTLVCTVAAPAPAAAPAEAPAPAAAAAASEEAPDAAAAT